MSKDVFSLAAYQFDVPPELIAQYPSSPRDRARLMIVNKTTGIIDEGIVADLPSILAPKDVLIMNDTRVLYASLRGRLEDGRAMECLLTKEEGPGIWWVMGKPSKRLAVGTTISFGPITALVVQVGHDGRRQLRFSEKLTPDLLQSIGSIPLPPYIRRGVSDEHDATRYQTIYGKHTGSVAAPTAGLHFTESLFDALEKRDISTRFVTLHVGMGTFLPIRVPDVRDHVMHEEQFTILPEEATVLNAIPSTSRRVAVGTTSCRVLETAVDENGNVRPGRGSTRLFVYPGHSFKFITSLITNFHTPGSSLLLLVSAFMGYDLMREAYAKAIEKRFRFFSYGDAMIII